MSTQPESTARRMALKTPEAAFVHVLEQEFHFAPRVAGEVLNAACEMLLGRAEQLRPGQLRVVVARLDAPFGPPLAENAKAEVTLTVDANATAHANDDPGVGLRGVCWTAGGDRTGRIA